MNTYSKPGNIPYRIRIGVTGHRQFNNKEIIIAKIREAIEKKIFGLYEEESKTIIESVTNTPFALSIITPLAEGADRLVAYEVLNAKEIKTKSGKSIPLAEARLEAVLPLKKEDYLQDFESAESKAEFEELLALSRRPISLRENLIEDEAGDIDPSESRKEAYLEIGKYVVDNCDVLIALWNGQPAAGKGGTAEVIDYAQKKNRPVIIISTTDPAKETEVRINSRLNAESLSNLDFYNSFEVNENTMKTYTDNIYDNYFPVYPRIKSKKESIFKRIEKKLKDLFYYNACKDDFPEQAQPGDERLNAIIDSIPKGTKELIRERLLPYYVKASLISKKYQRYYLRAGTLVYSVSALSALLIAITILFHEFSTAIFAIIFIILSLGYLTVMISDRKRVRQKWIENRFLTERIRASVFLAICGTEVSGIKIPPYNNAALKIDDWMILAFDEIWKGLPAMPGCSQDLMDNCKQYISYFWITDQRNYHKNKSCKSKRKNLLYENTGKVIFAFAVITALLHIFCNDLNIQEELLLAIVIILPVAGAAIGGIRSHREYSRHEKRSRYMVQSLLEYKETIENAERPARFDSALRDTEKLMLDETQDWLMIMRFVELKAEA